MSSAGRNSISSCFQHGLQDGYLSLKPHVKGGLFPLTRAFDRGPSQTPLTGEGKGTYKSPQGNAQTNDRSETGDAAFERSRRDGSKVHLIKKI